MADNQYLIIIPKVAALRFQLCCSRNIPMSSSLCPKCGVIGGGQSEADHSLGAFHRQLLNSNEPPDDSEAALITSTLLAADARMADIDRELARLPGRLKHLETERASIARFRAQHNNILSPIRRLPVEILSDIFSLTVLSARERQANDPSSPDSFQLMDSPWLLTHISGRWRATAISTPSLWSLITVICTPDANPVRAYPLAMVETQIARAKNLKIHFYACETGPYSEAQAELFRLLAKHSLRWEELVLRLTSHLAPLLSILHDRMPLLCRSIFIWEQWQSHPGVNGIGCFQSALSLVDVTIRGLYYQDHVVPFSILLGNLTRFELDGPWGIQGAIIQSAPNLVEARIKIKFAPSHGSHPWPDSTEIIHHPRLRTLFVSRPDVLNYLILPALEDLALSFDRDWSPRILQSVEAFVDRSSCAIRCLCLEGCSDADMTAEILQRIPSVVELRILHSDHESDGVHALMAKLSDPSVAPHLSCILLGHNQSGGPVDYSAYLEMVTSRWNDEHCAFKRTALVTEVDLPHTATLRSLEVLRQNGLDFALSQGTEAKSTMLGWTVHPRWF